MYTHTIHVQTSNKKMRCPNIISLSIDISERTYKFKRQIFYSFLKCVCRSGLVNRCLTLFRFWIIQMTTNWICHIRCIKIAINIDSLPVQPSVPLTLYQFFVQSFLCSSNIPQYFLEFASYTYTY